MKDGVNMSAAALDRMHEPHVQLPLWLALTNHHVVSQQVDKAMRQEQKGAAKLALT
ncbi:hypothetical protein IE4872_PC00164 (plasmid) [Rhizobium gallicum]|uniref:Uncharacterized protein n=1 Tax=Rhizobium gallicum TaxID=56730 RepID=A0A1L5NQP2_9HYPH|nr:hypothetical protein IE4872_PC00164 [Rhizobium gallicum]